MAKRETVLADCGLSVEFAEACVPHSQQPPEVRACLELLGRGVSRVLACKLTGSDPEGWDLELTLAENWRRAEMEIRLWSRFSVGADHKSLETWADCIAKDTGSTRTAGMTLRDALIDDPLVLAHLQAQEEAMLRAQIAEVDAPSASGAGGHLA